MPPPERRLHLPTFEVEPGYLDLPNPPRPPSRNSNPCAEIALGPREPATLANQIARRIRGVATTSVALDDLSFWPEVEQQRTSDTVFRTEYMGEFISDHHAGNGPPPVVTIEDVDLTAVSFGGDRFEPICEMPKKPLKPEPVYPSRFEREDVL